MGNLCVVTSDYRCKSFILLTNEEVHIMIRDCLQNNRGNQKKLYVAFYEYAMSICLRYAKNEEDAIEILNDGYLKIFKGLVNFTAQHTNVVADFKAWLKKIMIFTAIDHYRKSNKHQNHVGIEAQVLQIPHHDENQLDKLSHKEIIEAVQCLSPAYRTVFCLFVMDGFSHEEISKQLDINIGTSKSNLAKAKLNLQKMLENTRTLKQYEQRAV